MVITRKTALVVGAGIIAAALGLAAPAGADSGYDPCHTGELSITILCRLMPIAPGLDHDIDLTQGPGTLEGQALPGMPEGAPSSDDEAPAQLCRNGCS